MRNYRKCTTEQLLNHERGWRRSQTIATNHLDAIHRELRDRLTNLSRQAKVIAEAVKSPDPPPVSIKGRKSRKLDLND